MKTIFALTLAVLLSGNATRATTITYVGTQYDLGPGWRTTTTNKPLDIDGDNVLGTDGYNMVNLDVVQPAYLDTNEILTGTYPGNGGYAQIDDPTDLPSLFVTGTMNPSPGTGDTAVLFYFTLNSSAVGRTIRVGLMVDNLDIAAFDAADLELTQTNGTLADSGPVATTSGIYNDRVPDWIFFDIANAAAGDGFIIQGTGGINGYVTLGGVAFDSAVAGLPPATTETAANVYATTAMLNATVNPDGAATQVYFQYGTTPGYGNVTAPTSLIAGTAPVSVSNVLTGLTPDATYYFQVVASNSVGTNAGAQFEFTNGDLLVVTNAADDGSDGTLRTIVENADGGDTITFTNTLDGRTILLTSGGIGLDVNLTVDASSLPDGLVINGNSSGKIFMVVESTVVLNSLTITNGYANGSDGGGIANGPFSTLTLNHCTVSGNTATNGDGGGGIFNALASLTLNQCTVSGNSALGEAGGGIFNGTDGALTLNQCTVSGNLASDDEGGGILNEEGTVTLNGCTVSGNLATNGDGGGIFNVIGPVTLNECTVSGNSATNGDGGGIYNNDTLILNQCTVSGNSMSGGLAGGIFDSGGTANITNSIVGGNTGYDIDQTGGYLNYGGTNIVESFYDEAGAQITGANPIIANPELEPLGNYGGLTQTMLPMAGSPAIDAGSDPAAIIFATDQRGFPRFSGPQVDIGAVEVQQATVTTLPASGITATNATGNGLLSQSDLTNTWYFQYGTTTSYGSYSTTNTLSPGFGPVNVSNTLSNLAPATMYHYQIVSDDGLSTYFGADATFTTLDAPPSVVTGNPTAYATAAILTATVNPDGLATTWYFEYGPTPGYGFFTVTNTLPPGNSPVAVSAVATGFSAGDTIYFQIVTSNSLGTNDGTQVQFTTGQVLVVTTNSDDSSPGTLRNVVASAAANDTITFTNTLSGATILLTNAHGQIELPNSLAIDASALPNGITINGNAASRIFQVDDSSTALLNSLTITNGSDNNDVNYGGGGILDFGTLELANCTLSGNTADGSADGGGGIDNRGTLTLNQCILSGNSDTNGCCGSGGGGIINFGTLTLNQSTLSGNSADISFGGGGVYNEEGTLTLNECTLAGNSANDGGDGGGGILCYFGTTTLNQCTLSGNSANGSLGGGIFNNQGTLTLNQCTLSGNSAEYAGGFATFYGGATSATNSIIAANSASSGADIFNQGSTLTFGGSNIVESIDGFFNGTTPIDADPGLEPLGNYGGPTQTMLPMLGSPAIDAGCDSATNFFATDQRGFPRLSGVHVDIGAVEVQQATAATLAASDITATNAIGNGTVTPGDLDTSWYFEYGTNESYGADSTTNLLAAGFDPVDVTNALIDLEPGTTYHYQIVANDGVSAKFGGDITFTTLPVAPLPTTDQATSIGATNATLNATINPGGGVTAYYFEYGPTPSYGFFSTTNTVPAGNSPVGVSDVVNPLIPDTTYYYQVVAMNSAGTNDGTELSFTTLDGAPSAVTVTPTVVFATTATLTATVNPDGLATTWYFEYGPTPGYGYFTATNTLPAGNTPVGVSASVTGLSPGATLYFQIVTSNSLGTNDGAQISFTTGNILVVTSSADDGSPGTLRNIVSSAVSSDTITFTNTLSGATILLANGEIELDDNLTIDASALAGGILIDGNSNGPIFAVEGGDTVVLNSLTITNGVSTGSGGGIYNQGTLTLNQCTLSGNLSYGFGGGIFNNNNGAVTLNQCTLAGNSSTNGQGGGIYNNLGTLTLNECTLSGNSTPNNLGGGIFNFGTLALNQCTVSGNSASIGGGGIFNFGTAGITNSIVAGNSDDIYYFSSSLTYGGSNIVENTFTNGATVTGTTPINADPELQPLGNYGGPTQTMLPMPGSPAIDAASDFATNYFATDQRGFPRLSGLHVDIGAVEVQQATATTLAASNFTPTNATGNGTVTPGDLETIWYFEYGKNESYGDYSATNSLPSGFSLVDVSNALAGLLPGTTYYYQIVANDGVSDKFGGDITFTIPPVAPVATTDAASGIAATNATLNATINPGGTDASYYFEYGPTTNYGFFSTTNTVPAGNSPVGVSIVANPLVPGTTYYYQVVAGNSAGTNDGAELNFATPDAAPSAVTVAPTVVSATGATLTATINPDGLATTWYFEYGPTPGYGFFTATNTLPAGNSPVNVSAAITGLSPGATLYFQIVTSNSLGTNDGAQINFTTGNLLVVTTNSDDDNPGALRNVISVSGPGDTIIFTNTLSGATILLTHGNIEVNNSLTIDASALASGIAIDGDANVRIFLVFRSSTLALTSLTITNGFEDEEPGGAIYSLGTLTLNQCTLSGNSASNSQGGAIYNNNGTLTLNECTLSGNSAPNGSGGGIYNDGTLSLNQCTLSGNSAPNGSGGGFLGEGGTINITNCIVAGNSANAGDDIYNSGSALTYGGSNIVEVVDNASGSITGTTPINANPELEPLGNYGGPTQTMLPMTNSPAVDAGSDSTTNFFATDQRGYPRLSGLRVDIGAVELQQATVATLPASNITLTNAMGNGSVSPNDLTVAWYFQFGTTTNYGSTSTTNTLPPGFDAVDVSNALENLTMATTYHYQIVANDGVSTKYGTDTLFTTAPNVPVAITGAATNIGTTSATLNASINPGYASTAWYFQYGLTTNFGFFSSTNTVPVGDSPVDVSNVLTGLTPGATYYYQIEAENSGGTGAGATLTFTNAATPIVITDSEIVVAITSPANKFSTTNSSIAVKGTIKGGGSNPQLQVTVNTNTPVLAANGASSHGTIGWTYTAPLAPGANVITAQTIDTNGTEVVSAPAVITVFYITNLPVSSDKSTLTLTVSPTGSGKISGETTGIRLELNKVYTVKATPASGWILTNWTAGGNTNSVLGSNANLSFTMTSDLALQANFVANPFPAVAGSYNGLFFPTTGVSEESSGFFSANLATKGDGAYTAKLLLDGGSYSFSGSFDLSGDSEATVARAGKPPVDVILHINLNLPTPDDLMTGSVVNFSTDGWTSGLQADRALFSKSNPNTNYAGKYTLIIPPGSGAPANSPGGYSYATLANSSAGLVTLSGSLADKTTISQSTAVSKDGNIPLYVSLYSKKGSLLGWLTLTNETIVGTNLAWIKANIPHTLYATGFTNTNLTAIGSHYTGGFSLSDGTLTIAGGNLSSPSIFGGITVTNNKLTSTNTAIKGTITPSTGILTLTYAPKDGSKITAKGVVLQNTAGTNAAGWFPGDDESGYFLLQP